jgi:hypothetical protein
MAGQKEKKAITKTCFCYCEGGTPSPATKASSRTPPPPFAQAGIGEPFTPPKIIFQNFGKTFFLLTIDYQQVSKFI